MKAQSATEYALNYGWALVVVIIAAVSLYALGVFSPGAISGRTVAGFQELGTPVDWELSSDGEIRLKLANDKAASTVTIYRITVTLSGQDGQSTSYIPETLRIAPGKAAEVQFQLQPGPALTSLEKGSAYSARIAIVYNSGGYNHTDVGTVTGIAG